MTTPTYTRPAQLISLLSLVILSACEAAPSAPRVTPDIAQPSAVATRVITFRAEDADVAVVARCTLIGPEYRASFDTPAEISVPIGDDGRSLLTSVSCDFGDETAEWTGIPGPETRFVEAAFGGSGLFGEVALIYGPRAGTVQYYARRGELVRISGAPAP